MPSHHPSEKEDDRRGVPGQPGERLRRVRRLWPLVLPLLACTAALLLLPADGASGAQAPVFEALPWGALDDAPPSVSVLAPNGGELWAGGQGQTITWLASDETGLPAAPITVSVSYNAGESWSVLQAELPNSGSWPWTPPPIDSPATLIRVEAVDLAGNSSRDDSDAVFTIATSAPAAPQAPAADPAVWTNSPSFTVTWTNPAHLAPIVAAWYKLDAAPTADDDGTLVAATTSIAGIVPTADGAHPVYIWLQDQLGHTDYQQSASTLLYRDQTPPSPPSGLVGVPGRTWTNLNRFSEHWTNPPDLSGVVGAYYRIDSPGAFPTDGTLVMTTDTIDDIAVPGDGKHDLYIWLLDGAGNVNHNNRNVDPEVFWFDSTPPESTVTQAPALSATGWYSVPVTLSFAATDPPGGSGADGVYHRLDTGPWSALSFLEVYSEGPHTVSYYGRDLAGNEEVTRTLTVSLDYTRPVVNLAPAQPPQASGWYTASVAIDIVAADAPSGLVTAYYRLNGGSWQSGMQLTLSGDGRHVVDYYAEDAAGNRTTEQSSEFRVDATPPATAYRIEGTAGQDGWYTSPVTVTLIPTDAGSGVTSTHYRVNSGSWQAGTTIHLAADGSYTLAFYSVDAAGNTETGYPVSVKLDSAAPSAPIAVEVTPAQWSQVNQFSAAWANPTDLSGIAGVYYRLGREPTSSTDGVYVPLTSRLDGLTVPSEGTHPLYLWLRDGAGNADYRNAALAPLLRYDATAPSTAHTVEGLAGTNGWYRSAISVTLEAQDTASGPAYLSYRLGAAGWITTTASAALSLTVPDKYLLEFRSADNAGNVEPVSRVTLRLDPTAPPAPPDLAAAPAGWQHTNAFRLTWNTPLDLSGIAGIYVKFGAPPSGPEDGAFHAAVGVLDGLQAPAEGRHDVYAWLRDGAGNADPATAVALPDALWYDGTPPVTRVLQTGTLGTNGWYVEPVTFAFAASDAASGVLATRFRIDDGPWQEGHDLVLALDGPHVVHVASEDRAGNVEATRSYAVAIDRQKPVVRLRDQGRRQANPTFQVWWSGFDPQPGSGLASFDLQVRDGAGGVWRNWIVGTRATTAEFAGERGHTYYFRAIARDLAGNKLSYAESGQEVYSTVESMRNGSFDTGTFSEWAASGALYKAVVPMSGPLGASVLGARLGDEAYGPSLTDPGTVPVGSATISQTVKVPPAGQVAQPTLSLWYRVFSYDVMYSERLKDYVDTFEVWAYAPSGTSLAPKLLLRDGNPTAKYKELYDSGWKQALIDLKPYAGQTIQLVFSSYNRHDNLFNTWTHLDEVQVQGWPYGYRQYLSLLPADAAPAAGPVEEAVFEAAPVPETPQAADEKR